jgi:predicted porin
MIRILFILAFLLSLDASSNEFYGRIAVDTRSTNLSEESETDVESNESKVGFKGSFKLNEDNGDLSLIYQAEYGFDPVDGKARGDEGTFKQRNTFLGIKSKNYGTLMAGTHDTAFKKAQFKIDLFNDLLPDIKNILQGENRLEDYVGYISPKFKNYFFTINSIKNSNPGTSNYKSYSVHYTGDKFSASVAIDDAVKGYDSSRYSLLVPLGSFQFGFIFQDSKKISTNASDKGKVISVQKKLSDKNKIKFQYADSDMKVV